MRTAKRMFVTDLDGTLFTDKRVIHEKDMAALKTLGKKGVVRVFATGRSIYSFQKAVALMGFSSDCNDMPVDYVIFSTGAGIMECSRGEIIKSESLKATDVWRISDCFDRHRLDYMVHKPVPDTRYFVYKTNNFGGETAAVGDDCALDAGNARRESPMRDTSKTKNPRMENSREEHLKREKSRAEDPKSEKNPDFHARIALYHRYGTPMGENGVNGFGEATEVLAIVPPARGHGVADIIQQTLSEFSVIRATSPLDGQSVWIEVFSPGVSKSRAASWLAGSLEVRQKDVMAVGNDYNDLDLLAWAGKGFAVANAPEAVRDRFETVPSNNMCGVAELVERLYS